MTILSAQTIRRLRIIDPCLEAYKDARGNSAGLSVCGYDLTLAQDVQIYPNGFQLASAAEKFNLPTFIAGIVHDKSSLARRGLAVQNTIAEPGWRGYLTLELSNHGRTRIILEKGCAIAQVVFHMLDEATENPYDGKYQDQETGPQESKMT